MEYNEFNENDNGKKNNSIGFYAIIGCCLIILGAVAWFAVSAFAKRNTVDEKNQSSQNGYSSNNSNKNKSNGIDDSSSILSPSSSQITAGEKSDVPYSSEEETKALKKAFVLPVEGQILKGYSDSALQFSSTFGDMRLHTGIDIKCEKNTQIKASAAGTVTEIKDDASFGKIITVDHGDKIVLNYCGLNSISVKAGQSVSSGDILGTVGNVPCESSDGIHLHLSALIDGKTASPLKALGLE